MNDTRREACFLLAFLSSTSACTLYTHSRLDILYLVIPETSIAALATCSSRNLLRGDPETTIGSTTMHINAGGH